MEPLPSEETLQTFKSLENVSDAQIHKRSLGWSKVVFLPFNKLWMFFVVLVIYFQCVSNLYDTFFSTNDPNILRLIFFELICVFDTSLALIHRIWKTLNARRSYLPRPKWWLFLDVVSLYPLAICYYAFSEEWYDRKLFYLLLFNNYLRLYRVIMHFASQRDTVQQLTYRFSVLEYFFEISLFLHLFACLWYHTTDKSYNPDDWSYAVVHENIPKNSSDSTWYSICLYYVVQIATSTGPGEITPKPQDLREITLTVILFYIGYGFTTGFIIGSFNAVVMGSKYQQLFFWNYVASAQKYLDNIEVSQSIMQSITNYYSEFWRYRSGIKKPGHYRILPTAVKMELSLDICWDAFKHAHLFKNMSFPALRALSLYLKHEFHLTGDVLYRQNVAKHEMIYIVTGIVQISSSEDDESPIISLSGATCLGETSLFISYPSKTDVKCTTYCEVLTLSRKDFISVMHFFPEDRNNAFLITWEKYHRAKQMKEYCISLGPTFEKNLNVIKWLKGSLKMFMLEEKIKYMIEESDYLSHANQIDTKHLFVHYTSSNLDHFVITKEVALKTDAICLTNSFPWILQADTDFIYAWNTIIVLVATVVGLAYPYFAAIIRSPHSDSNSWIYVIDILYFVDVYIHSMTAIKLGDELIVEPMRILNYRIKTWPFILDILAIVPLEVLVIIVPEIKLYRYVSVVKLNRVIKMWKVFKFIGSAENRLINSELMRSVQLLFVIFVFLYWLACIAYMMTCFWDVCEFDSWYATMANFEIDRDGESYQNTLAASLYYVSAFFTCTSSGDIGPKLVSEILATIGFIILGLMVRNFVVAEMVAIEIFNQFHETQFEETVKDFSVFLKSKGVPQDFVNRPTSFLRRQWRSNRSKHTLTGLSYIDDLPPLLKDMVLKDTIVPILEQVSLFKDCPDKFLLDVAKYTRRYLVSPGGMIAYAGDISYNMFIIEKGFVKVTAGISKIEDILGPVTALSVIGSLLGVPQMNTIEAVTHCTIITLNVKDFQKVLREYSDIERSLNEVVVGTEEYAKVKLQEIVWRSYGKKEDRTEKSWINIGANLPPLSADRKYYLEPFEKMGNVKFVRFLFLNKTIHPCGKFLELWECGRALLAFLSAMLFPALYTLERQHPIFFTFAVIFDVFAVLDLYVRLHVAYFNENGLLISHPTQTSYHYITHAFVTDFIACFPFELFAPPVQQVFPNTVNYYANLLRWNRVIQIYRVPLLLKDLAARYILGSSMHRMLFYLLIALVSMSLLSAIIVIRNCTFGGSEKDFLLNCGNISWIGEKAKTKSSYIILLSVQYWVISMIFEVGIDDIQPAYLTDLVVIITGSIISLLLLIYLNSTEAKNRAITHSSLTSYQEKMKILISYMNERQIDGNLQEEIINTYESMWANTRGIKLQSLREMLHPSLRMDLMYNIYGKLMERIPIFSGQDLTFYRSLCYMIEDEVYFVKGAQVLACNSICSNIFIIIQGSVDVIDSDGMKNCSLHHGSMFGNLDMCEERRMAISIFAKGTARAIYMTTLVFYELLKNFHQVTNRLEHSLASNLDFVQASTRDYSSRYYEEEEERSIGGSSTSSALASEMFNVHYKRIKWLLEKVANIWHGFVAYFCSYVSIVLETYDIAFESTDSVQINFIVYTIHIFYGTNILLRFFEPYKDEYGNVITDVRSTSWRYLKLQRGFWFDFITAIPFQLFVSESNDVFSVPLFLRLNCLLRVVNIYDFFNLKMNKLNISVEIVRMWKTLTWMTLLMHCFSCTLVWIICRKLSCITDEDQYDSPEAMRYSVYCEALYQVSALITRNNAQRSINDRDSIKVFIIVLLVISMPFTINFTGEICAVQETRNIIRAVHEYEARKLKVYLKYVNLSSILQSRIWTYVCAMWEHRKNQHFPLLLLEPPDYIQISIKYAVYRSYLLENPVFYHLHESFMRLIASKVEEYQYFSENYIAYEGDMNRCVYFIYEGEVEVLKGWAGSKEEIVDIIESYNVFGVIQGISDDKPYKYTYKARTQCTILTLFKDDWWYLLEYFPAVYSQIRINAKNLQESDVPPQLLA